MIDSLCKTGLFVHTARAKRFKPAPDADANQKPAVAPRVALDVMMLPVNLVLGTKPCNLQKRSDKLRTALEGPIRPARLGALGLVNRALTHCIKGVGTGCGGVVGMATAPLALLLRQDAGAWVGSCLAGGTAAGAAVGFFIGAVLEWARAAARWCITHPHHVAFLVLVCVVYIAAAAAVEAGLVHAGVPQSLANLMAQVMVYSLTERILAEDPDKDDSVSEADSEDYQNLKDLDAQTAKA